MTIGPKPYAEATKYVIPFEFEKEQKQFVRIPLYARMADMVYQDRFKIYATPLGRVSRQTPKGIYRAEGQPEGQLTRAWLEFGPYERVSFKTDVIDTSTGMARVIEDSEYRHFYVTPMHENSFSSKDITSVHLESDFHEGMMATEEFDFWTQVSASLDFIDQKIQNAHNPSVGSPVDRQTPATTELTSHNFIS